MTAELARNPGFVAALRRRVGDSGRALSEVFRSDDLRRLQLSSAASVAAEWAYTVALSVYAYNFGGAAWVGIVGLIRMLPSAVAAPLASLVLDRYPRQRVLVFVYGFLSASLAVSALAVIAGIPALVFGAATVLTLAASIQRPAEWSLRPVLADTPQQLAATNVAASMVEGVSVFLGPAAAGVLLVKTGPDIVFLAGAQVYWLASFFVSRISIRPKAEIAQTSEKPSVWSGMRAVADNKDPRLLIALFGAQTFVRGALNVLIVVAAIKLLDLGDPGVGYLNSAFGVGNLIGAIAALTLVGRARLAGPFGWGLAMWGAPIALVGLWPHPAAAIVLLAIPGFGNGVLDVAGLTLVQRITPDEILGRVFGVLGGIVMATIALGSIITPVVIFGLGIRGALIAVGLFLPVLALVASPRLRAIDGKTVVPEAELALLHANAIFGMLSPFALEKIASRLFELRVPAGAEVITEGDEGDLFFLIAEGEFEVSRGGSFVALLGRGDGFGEIALLRDQPRMATVTANSNGVVYSLDRHAFLTAVAGHTDSRAAADTLIRERLPADE